MGRIWAEYGPIVWQWCRARGVMHRRKHITLGVMHRRKHITERNARTQAHYPERVQQRRGLGEVVLQQMVIIKNWSK